MTPDQTSIAGPILFLDHAEPDILLLSALFLAPHGAVPPPVETDGMQADAILLARHDGFATWRARFTLPLDRMSSYRWNGEEYAVAGDFNGALRLAYVSCNGEEHGDLDRGGAERNAMWARLCARHREAPFALLLHGGDQVYADEITDGHELTDDWPSVPANPSAEALADLRHHLRESLARRYLRLYRSPEFAWIAARVPSLMQWDDHDICDGWGSLAASRMESAVGQTLFSVAREGFLLFQQAACEGDLPGRFHGGAESQLGWSVRLPGLRLIAPDLRSERTRRRVMGDGGWNFMEAQAAEPFEGHSFLLSSVPLLGPRLSLVELMLTAIPRMQKYEDDLRDQWQSRAHRAEWQRMLRLVASMAEREGQGVTAVSGEIHLATRAFMQLAGGRSLHQLVASGIAHRAPPKAWARTLGALATLGEDPLPERPIRIAPLPGIATRYVAERNFLTLERDAGRWSARWELEESGITPPLAL